MSWKIINELSQQPMAFEVHAKPSTRTTHEFWDPIERIHRWVGFDFEALLKRYRKELETPISPYTYRAACEQAQAHVIVNEESLVYAITPTIMSISRAINKVRPKLFLGPGSRVSKDPSAEPDWGCGVLPGQRGICPAIIVGEAKAAWDPIKTIQLMQKYESYEDYPSIRNEARPFEQLQWYHGIYSTRFTFVFTDRGLTIIQATLARPDAKTPSPRPKRNQRAPSHQRVLSGESMMSDISETMSKMSFQPSEQHIEMLEVLYVPWGNGPFNPQMVFFLIAMEAFQNPKLAREYPPLADEPSLPRQLTNEPPKKTLFLPKERIDPEVLRADISLHLKSAKVLDHDQILETGAVAYVIETEEYSQETIRSIIRALIEDSAEWRKLRREVHARGGASYAQSDIHKRRASKILSKK